MARSLEDLSPEERRRYAEILRKRQQRTRVDEAVEEPDKYYGGVAERTIADLAMAVPRGVEGFVQSTYNLADTVFGDTLPDYETRLFGRSTTPIGGFAEGTVQFLTGFIPIAGQLSKVQKLAKLGGMGRAAIAGAATDFVGFDGREARLSNLINSSDALRNPVTEFLAADEEDGQIKGRIKNVFEGAGLGAASELVYRGLRAIKHGRKLKSLNEPEEQIYADQRTILEGDEPEPTFGGRIRQTFRKMGRNRSLLRFREQVDNKFIFMRKAQSQSQGGYIKDRGKLKVEGPEQDVAERLQVAEGVKQERSERVLDLANNDTAELKRVAKRLKKSPEELDREVEQVMWARHGRWVNSELYDGAAGISNKEIDRIMVRYNMSSLKPYISDIIKQRSETSKQILNVMQDAGLVSKKTADALRKKYPDYVPLNRIMDDDGNIESVYRTFTFKRSDVSHNGVYALEGSDKKVAPIYRNILFNLSQAMRKAEDNISMQSLDDLIESNVHRLESEKNISRELAEEQLGMRVIKDKVKKKVEKKAKLKETGEEIDIVDEEFVKNPKAKESDLVFYRDGQRYRIQIDDPDLARSLKGQATEEMFFLFRAGMTFNRLLSSIYTRLNPSFMIPNKVRDLQEAFINNSAKIGFGRSLSGLSPKRNLEEIATIRRAQSGKLDPNKRGIDKIYQQAKEDGALSGGMGLSTRAEVDEKLDALLRSKNMLSGKKLGKSFLEFMDKANDLFENSTRLSAYRNAIAKGATRQRAASIARNSSFDPLLKGTKSPYLQSMFLFINPAIQGTKNFYRSMSKPKTAMTALTGMGALSYTLERWNSFVGGDDYRAKLSSATGSNYLSNRNFVVVTGQKEDGGLNYVTIPTAYSLMPLKIGADLIAQLAMGKGGDIDPETATKELMGAAVNSYNPTGGGVMPTPLRPMYELEINRDGLGRQIRPLEKNMVEEVYNKYSYTADTFGGEMAISMAETLANMNIQVSPENIQYLYETFTGGTGKFLERVAGVTSKAFNGEEIQVREIPIARRFFGSNYETIMQTRTGALGRIQDIKVAENTERQQLKYLAARFVDDVVDIEDPAKRREIFMGYANENPKMRDEYTMKKIEDFYRDRKLGLTKEDYRRRNLSSNEMRAKSILEELKVMKSEEERRAFLADQQRKLILTEGVMEELNPMLLRLEALGGFQNR